MKRLQEILVRAGYSVGNSGPNKDGIDGIPGKKTRDAATKYIVNMCKQHGYKFFKDNIYALRVSDDFTDKFTDFALVFKGGVCVACIPWTTKPGKYWISNPVTVGGITGTGCMVEGQWMDSHRYEATPKKKWGNAGYFIQHSPILVYRDGNKNNRLDKNITQHAPTWYGFFLHAMGRGFKIWNWSAGCNGCSLNDWKQNIDPYFKDGDIINYTIFDVILKTRL
jgi:hypothetical protein